MPPPAQKKVDHNKCSCPCCGEKTDLSIHRNTTNETVERTVYVFQYVQCTRCGAELKVKTMKDGHWIAPEAEVAPLSQPRRRANDRYY